MKKAILGLVLSLTAVIVFGQANVPVIVVTTFSTRGQTVTADDAEGITELFMAELAKQSGVRVVDRTSLDRVIAEMRFQTTDWSDSQKTAQLGAALNAEFLVRGQINQLGSQISFVLTAFDIKTLEVVSSSTRNFSADTIFSTGSAGLFNNIPLMASQIVDSLPPANYFIGRWQTPDGNCILEFRTDGTVRVERYVYGSTTYNSGTGVYSFDRYRIKISLNVGSGVFIPVYFSYSGDVAGDVETAAYTFDSQKNSFSFDKFRTSLYYLADVGLPGNWSEQGRGFRYPSYRSFNRIR